MAKHTRIFTSICCAATVLLIVAASAWTQDVPEQDPPRVDVSKITDNIYLFECSAQFAVNCIAVTGDDGILLIDSGLQQTAELLAAALDKLDSGPVKHLINTHGHADHTGGNTLFGETATIIAHENLEKELKRGYGLLREFPEAAQPDISFYKDYSLRVNGEEVKLLYYPGSHHGDDVVVHLATSGVVCMGDLFSPGDFPWVDPTTSGDVTRFTKNIFKIMTKFPNGTKFIPGHGPVSTAEDLGSFYDMLVETTAIVQQGLDDGKTVETMQTEDILKDWDSWGDGFVSKDLWIQTVANGLDDDARPGKKPILEPLYYTLQKDNAAAAIEQYHRLKKSHPGDYDFGEANLNALGYYLLGKERYEDAIALFTLNTELFPESANPYDSLGEAYMRSGDKTMAIKSYEKALEIAPEMPSAIQALKQLKEK